MIKQRRLPSISLFWSLQRRPSCKTLSNAFDKFRKTTHISNKGLASKALKILQVIYINWFMQETFVQNPDSLLLNRMLHKIENINDVSTETQITWDNCFSKLPCLSSGNLAVNWMWENTLRKSKSVAHYVTTFVLYLNPVTTSG